jgi:ABC-2 type transport system permease protein
VRQVLVLTAADLRQRVRDRTVLIFGLLVPLGLMGVFNLVFSGVTEDLEIEPVTVAVSAPAGDQLAGVVIGAVSGLEAVEVTLERTDPDRALAMTRDGDADLGIVVPADFAERVRRGEAVEVEVREGEGAGLGTDIVLSVVEGVLQQVHASAVGARAAAIAGVPAEQLDGIARDAATGGPAIELTQGRAAGEQLSAAGAVVAGQTGLFLLFTVSFGVLALLYEREEGTLARLASMPIRLGAVVAAKALSGFALGVGASVVLLTAGSLMFGVDLGSPLPIAVLVLAAVAAATSLTFVVARIAGTAEQAQIAQSVLAMSLGIAGGAFFPVSASGPLAVLLDLNPVAGLIRGLGITSGGGGLADLTGVLGVLLAFALVTATLSRLLPDRGGAR